MFDRRALEAFFKNRRNALSNAKKAKMKMTKQQQQQQQPPQQHPVSATMRQQADMTMVRKYEEILIIVNTFSSEYSQYPCFSYTGCIKKKVIELWSALARSLYNLQKAFFHSREDQAFSFRMSPFL